MPKKWYLLGNWPRASGKALTLSAMDASLMAVHNISLSSFRCETIQLLLVRLHRHRVASPGALEILLRETDAEYRDMLWSETLRMDSSMFRLRHRNEDFSSA